MINGSGSVITAVIQTWQTSMKNLPQAIMLLSLFALTATIGCSNSDKPKQSHDTGASTASNIRTEADSALVELIEQSRKLHLRLCFDDQRNDASFLDLDVGKLGESELNELTTLLRESIARWSERAELVHPSRGETKEQHLAAIARLNRKEFDVDPKIPVTDVESIVKYIETNTFLDSQVLRLELRDENTVFITTGVVKGPLSGGGSYLMARRENGKWIVRMTSMGWVS